MEDGRRGQCGFPAHELVEMEFRDDFDIARTRRH